MLSVMVSFRNQQRTAVELLRSMLRAFNTLGTTDIEFLLIDDASDPAQQIPQLLAEFHAQLPANVRVTQFLFKQHQHYTRALAYGLSAAKGDHVLFVSHDMRLPAQYVTTLLAVSTCDASIGL